jgi:hypothetical protein
MEAQLPEKRQEDFLNKLIFRAFAQEIGLSRISGERMGYLKTGA